eukprot:4771101-Alexandrium_andersonii.AAC.1
MSASLVGSEMCIRDRTFPDPSLLARTSVEEFKQAITDLGFYVDRSGEHEERTPIGLMDRGRLLEFRAR